MPILGVCLGHQAIGQAFGGRIVRAQRVMHGKLSPVTPRRQRRVRRAAVAADRDALPFAGHRARVAAAELEVTATADDGEIMGVRHARFAVEGVQFHPEAILTEHGHAMLRNFLEGRA